MTVLDQWGAALSHRSAAALWGLLPPADGVIDISVPAGSGKRGRRGIRLHRYRSLLPADVTLLDGIPVTTAVRTLADLRRAVAGHSRRGLVTPKELRRATRQADVLGLPIADGADRDGTRSDLEWVFLRLCARYGLSTPEVNVQIGRDLVDFAWLDRRLVVETDGYRFHRGRAAFEDDRDRDLRLRATGYEVIRLSNRQVRGEPSQVASVIQLLLSERLNWPAAR